MARLPNSRTFRGFVTNEKPEKVSSFCTRYDIDVIICDLKNHFYTRMGERLMRPDLGCRIWDYIMEPFTATNRDLIVAEVERVCRFDTRLDVESVNVIEARHGIIVSMDLIFRPYGITENFKIEFENRQN